MYGSDKRNKRYISLSVMRKITEQQLPRRIVDKEKYNKIQRCYKKKNITAGRTTSGRLMHIFKNITRVRRLERGLERGRGNLHAD